MNDCQRLVNILEAVVDGQASKEDETFFNEHIEDCAPCLEHYELDQSLVELVRQSLERKKCTANLLGCIKEEISKI